MHAAFGGVVFVEPGPLDDHLATDQRPPQRVGNRKGHIHFGAVFLHDGDIIPADGQGLGLLAARAQDLDNLRQVDVCERSIPFIFEWTGAVLDVVADQQNAPAALAQGIGREKEREARRLARGQRELRRRNVGLLALGMRLDLQHRIADVGGH